MTDDVFLSSYAASYDLLYRDKDYGGECDFIEAVLDRYGVSATTVLDIGCGTGEHALRLAARGYRVVGVDRSEPMLEIARRKARREGLDIRYVLGDARRLDLGETFDAAVAMFAVMSYQTTNEDLAAVCRGVRKHLAPGGVFLFDGWHGPGVLHDPPVHRIKTVEADGRRIIRMTEPTMDVAQHTVATRFNLLTLRDQRVESEVEECHRMRFLFPQEVAYFLEVAGFTETSSWPFLRLGDVLNETHWHLATAARAPLREEP